MKKLSHTIQLICQRNSVDDVAAILKEHNRPGSIIKAVTPLFDGMLIVFERVEEVSDEQV